MTQLNQNTTDLQSILDAVNALPEAGGASAETCTITIDNTNGGFYPSCIIATVDSINSTVRQDITSKGVESFTCRCPTLFVVGSEWSKDVITASGNATQIGTEFTLGVTDSYLFFADGDATITVSASQ